jgi:CubicO group peptidase (beta-lactamase class C family)
MQPMMKLLLFLALAACGGASPPPPAAPESKLTADQQQLADRLDATVKRAIAGKPMAGLSVAVVARGDLVLARGYGFADLGAKRPAAADTIYRVGSITKSFTAAVIVKLAAQGKLAIDDPITRYLPGYDTHGATITIRHLLNHTSGIPGYTEIEAFWPRAAQSFPRAELVKMFEPLPLKFPPGSRWSYSNSGYYLLGLIIEKVTGGTYAQALRDQLFAPAKLGSSTYCADEQNGPRDARPYELKGGKPVPAEPIEMDHPYAAGAICSTVTDLAVWLRALASHTIVTADQWTEMTTPVKLTDGTTFPYGFGLMTSSLDGHARVGHNGGINGFHTTMAYYPADDLLIVAMANTGGGLVEDVGEQLARTALDLPAPVILDEPLTAEQAAAYTGRYEFADVPIKLELRYHDGKLEAANLGPDGNPIKFLPLRHQGNHVFAAPEVKATMTFTIEAGRATAITVEQGGLKLRGTPMK